MDSKTSRTRIGRNFSRSTCACEIILFTESERERERAELTDYRAFERDVATMHDSFTSMDEQLMVVEVFVITCNTVH